MMTVTYEGRNSIYVNMTNRCPCACTFCLRHNDDHVFNSASLWLEREPTVSEVCESIDQWDLSSYDEVVFCGYGEPTERLDDLLLVAKYIKSKSNIPLRINTNGLADLIAGEKVAHRLTGLIDTVSISLNTPSSERYDELCLPKFGGAHGALIVFAGRVRSFVPHTVLSVVRQTLTEQELEECRRIARDAGVELKIRDYIPPEP